MANMLQPVDSKISTSLDEVCRNLYLSVRQAVRQLSRQRFFFPFAYVSHVNCPLSPENERHQLKKKWRINLTKSGGSIILLFFRWAESWRANDRHERPEKTAAATSEPPWPSSSLSA